MTAKPQPHNHAGHSCHCHSSDSKETGARNVVRDPVCGMKVDRAAARHMAKQEGRRFYFCSSRCQEKFEAEPTEINHNYLNLQLFPEIGRATCRERVCQYVSIWVVAVSLKKKRKT